MSDTDNYINHLLVQASVSELETYFTLQYAILRLPPTRHNSANYHDCVCDI